MFDKWVIDATMGCPDGLFCFCPIEGDLDGEFTVVTGMNYRSNEPPPKVELVGIVHADGQEMADRFCKERKVELDELRERLKNGNKVV